MYSSFKVKNFRCFQDFNIDSLERVNLFAGMNNVGKTALLEAFYLHCGAYNPQLALRINAFRGIEELKLELARSVAPAWDSLFNKFDISKNIELEGENSISGHSSLRIRSVHKPSELKKIPSFARLTINKPSEENLDKPDKILSLPAIVHVLEFDYQEKKQHSRYYMIFDQKGIRYEPIPPAPPFPAYYQGARIRSPFPAEAELFGRLETHKKQDVLLRILQIIEPKLKRLALVFWAGNPILHGDIGIDKLIPLPILGEGMVRLASFVLRICNAPKGVVLIDEIENGIHHSIMKLVWKAIGQVAREFNTQIFATTHSLECAISAHKAFKESKIYDFRLHRLEQVKEAIRVITYKQENLDSAIEMGLEVR